MSDIPPDFDLKFLPDWLKESPSKNAYSDYEGETEERPRRDFRGPKPQNRDRGQGRGPGPNRGGGDRRDSKPRDGRRGDLRPPRREHAGGDRRQGGQPVAAPALEKNLPVKLEFLPEPHCTTALAKQIKASARAYPLFDLARMFLGKPDRHRVKITSTDQATPLFQSGEDGPVSLDRQTLERGAFPALKHLYYEETTVQGEPPKGNYSNVARCRLNGALLGPTNHHAYQPGLRKLYEERFSRRMSFPEFQREIEVVSDPAAIEAWKEQSRSVTTYKTLKEAEPLTFNSASEAEAHFRANYLPQTVREGKSFELSGEASRNVPDRSLSSAIRQTWEAENRFPGHVMNHLRREFIHAGLYIFKHHNRVQLVSAIRPAIFGTQQQTLSDSVAEILKVIAATPKCTRAELAAKIVPSHEEDPTKTKAQLASDLHWLTHAGHVIEFHNGILEIPSASDTETPKKHGKQQPSAKATAPATPAKETVSPVTETPAPAVEAAAPAVETPAVAEEEPVAAAETPVASAPEPAATVEEPSQPAAEAPEPTGEAPTSAE